MNHEEQMAARSRGRLQRFEFTRVRRSSSWSNTADARSNRSWYDDVVQATAGTSDRLTALKHKIATLEFEEARMKINARKEAAKETAAVLLQKAKEPATTIKAAADKTQRKWRGFVTGDEEQRIRDHVKEKARNKVDSINRQRKIPKVVRTIDKIVFTAGVCGLSCCQYLILLYPTCFWQLFLAVIPILIALKLLYYRTKEWQYFLIDFCYFTNLLCTLLVLIPGLRDNVCLMKTTFIFANGPVAFAVPVWAVQLVFHDFDKVNTTYVHVMPMLLLFTLRWYPSEAFFPNFFSLLGQGFHAPSGTPPSSTIDWWDMVVAMFVYSFWQASYLFVTEWWLAAKLSKNPNLRTSLRYLSQNKKNGMHCMVKQACRSVGIFTKTEEFNYKEMKTLVIFCSAQFMYTLLTIVPTPFLYYSYHAHLAFCLGILVIGIYNGASFYIEVFSCRYQDENEKRWQEFQEQQDKGTLKEEKEKRS